jgi:hypothetical protein
MKATRLLVTLLFLAVTARGQDFHAYSSTETLVEGGRVDKLVITSGDFKFNVHPPRNWYRQVDAATRKVIFTSPSGKSALTLLVTTNSPGELSDKETLRAEALRAHPGAGVIQTSVCPTTYHPGVLFDLVHLSAPGVVQKIRHAYIPQPSGRVELVLSASADEFEQNKMVFMSVARAFRVDRLARK